LNSAKKFPFKIVKISNSDEQPSDERLERHLAGEEMAEALEVVGQILEDRGHTHKFYAPDSSSDEELEVCCRDLKEK
jgi:hypothetical protein